MQTRYPGRVVAVVGDLADEQLAIRNSRAAPDSFGRLDVLVNNAGRTLNQPSSAPRPTTGKLCCATTPAGTRQAVRAMVAAGRGGSIVSVASYAATIALPEGSAYAASKGTIAQLMRGFAIKGAPHGIRSHIPRRHRHRISQSDPPRRAGIPAHLRPCPPLGRIAPPSETAAAILFLASERASFITGALLPVDGWFTAQ